MERTTPVITLVDVRQERRAVHVLYELMRQRSTEDDPNVNISHRALPSFEEHARFFAHPPYFAWYLIRANWCTHAGKPGIGGTVVESGYAGYVSITFRNEVGIVLFKSHRGRGIGRIALAQLLQRHRPLSAIPSQRAGRFLANINPANERSIALFCGLGFHLIQHTYAFDPPKEERP